tara:strand:- start:572 stop:1177 length:606 start_codon:yes stop_codon:yes gene_type:complete
MDSISDINKIIDQSETQMKKVMRNPYVYGLLNILLISYSCLIVPKLPENILALLDNIVAKIVVVFLIAYVSNKNASVSLMIAVAFIVTIQLINQNKIKDITEITNILKGGKENNEITNISDEGIENAAEIENVDDIVALANENNGAVFNDERVNVGSITQKPSKKYNIPSTGIENSYLGMSAATFEDSQQINIPEDDEDMI